MKVAIAVVAVFCLLAITCTASDEGPKDTLEDLKQKVRLAATPQERIAAMTDLHAAMTAGRVSGAAGADVPSFARRAEDVGRDFAVRPMGREASLGAKGGSSASSTMSPFIKHMRDDKAAGMEAMMKNLRAGGHFQEADQLEARKERMDALLKRAELIGMKIPGSVFESFVAGGEDKP